MKFKFGKPSLLLVFLGTLLSPKIGGCVESWISNFNPDDKIVAMARSNGMIYIGGLFKSMETFTSSAIVLDPSGNRAMPNLEIRGGKVFAAVSDGVGGWYVGGDFKIVNGVDRVALAHIQSDGQLDMNFVHPFEDGTVNFLLLRGKDLFVGGKYLKRRIDDPYYQYSNLSSIDVSLNVFQEIKSDLIGNRYTSRDYGDWNGIAGICMNDNVVYVAVEQSADSVSDKRSGILRIPASGTEIDEGWKIDKEIWHVTKFPFAVGDHYVYFQQGLQMKRFDKSIGSEDLGWSFNLEKNYLYSLASFGPHIYILSNAGAFRLNEQTGDRDNGWNPKMTWKAERMAFDGSIYLADESHLARISFTDGSIDNTWSPQALLDEVETIGAQGNGTHLFVGGKLTPLNSAPLQYLARLRESDGALDSIWNLSPNGPVNEMTVEGDSLYVGGAFSEIGDTTVPGIVRINTLNGTIDPSWHPPLLDVAGVNGLFVTEEKVYIGGVFTRINGKEFPGLARLEKTDGTLDQDWGPAVTGGTAQKLAVSTEGIYVALSNTESRIIRLNEINGDLDLTWTASPFTMASIRCLSPIGNVVYVGGSGNDKTFLGFSKTDGTKVTNWKWGSSITGISKVGGLANSLLVTKIGSGGIDLLDSATRRSLLGKHFFTDNVESMAVGESKMFLSSFFYGERVIRSIDLPPAPPTDFKVTELTGRSISTSWTPTLPGGYFYMSAQEKNGSDTPYLLEQEYKRDINNAKVSGLTGNTTYYLFVNHGNGVAESNFVEIGPIVTPLAPSDIDDLSAIYGANSVYLYVLRNNSEGTMVDIEKSTDGINFDFVISTKVINTRSAGFTIVANRIYGLEGNKKYYFRVRATRGDGVYSEYSEYSAVKSVLTKPDVPEISPISGVTDQSISGGFVRSEGIKKYVMFASTSPILERFEWPTEWVSVYRGKNQEIAGLVPNTTYYVFVEAENETGSSDIGYIGSTVTLAATPPLYLSGMRSYRLTVDIYGNLNPEGTWYEFEQKTGDRDFEIIQSSTNSWVEGKTEQGIHYEFRARARNHSGVYSPYSISLNVDSEPQPPLKGEVLKILEDSVTVSWDVSVGALKGYQLKVSLSSAPDSEGIQTLKTEDRSASVSSLTPNTTYYFYVNGVNAEGESKVVPIGSAVTKATVPALKMVSPGLTNVKISLDTLNNPPGTQYFVENKEVGADTFSFVLSTTSSLFQVSNLKSGRDYAFRVRAQNHQGVWTNYSSPAVARTGSIQVDESKAYPIPYRGNGMLTFERLPINSMVKVYSMGGELIKTLNSDGSDIHWDVRNEEGSAVSSGVYLVRVEGGGSNKTFKIIIQR